MEEELTWERRWRKELPAEGHALTERGGMGSHGMSWEPRSGT